jgi:Flp pilus assembly protein TadG
MAIRNRKLAALLRDNQGNVLPIAAVAMMVTATIVGGGVDLSRAYRVQSRLQYACDAGVLAGRKTVSSNGFDQTVQDTASDYFDANFDRNGLSARSVNFSTSSQNNGQTINGTARATVDSAVVKVIGMNSFNLSANCSSSMGVGNSDVMMVLDVTGSMDDPIVSGGSSNEELLRYRFCSHRGQQCAGALWLRAL